ncbi:F0F1 ATP synthase subunit alpha, partial [bacterium]|nr:F0F1 ATP synthase subunit alpha [bacterium]
MKLRPEEISSVLSQELQKYDRDLGVQSVGTILQVGDGIARIYGLQDVMAGELIQFPGDTYGMVLNLEEDSIGAAIFGSDTHIKEGDQVTRTGRIAEVPVGDGIIGRVVN